MTTGSALDARQEHGDALQAASPRSHEKVVELLLEKGAEVNAQGGAYSSVLHAGTPGGYETIVDLLLKRGANVQIISSPSLWSNIAIPMRRYTQPKAPFPCLASAK
jgi:hypothetical protein